MTASRAIAETRFLSAFIRGGKRQCWNWNAGKNKRGYGYFNDGQRQRWAHRYAYERIHGQLTSAVAVRLPFVRQPALRPIRTISFCRHQKAIATDMVAKGRSPAQIRTSCRNGHAYSADNLFWRRHRDGYLYRACRICARAACNRSYARRGGAEK